jgi:hypothetical protein
MRNHVLIGTLGLIFGAGAFAVVGCGADDGSSSGDTGDASTSGADGSTTKNDAGTSATDAGSAPKLFTITASVVGLEGTGLVLNEKTLGDVAVTAQGGATQKVTITTKAASGTAYDVSVKTQPSGPPQKCEVTGGKGTVVEGDVASITVNCTTLYTVGGTVSGLAGKDLILENNGTADSVTINANGQFAFPKPLATGSPWAVTVKADPTAKWQTCKVSVGDGGTASGTIATANVTNVDVTCTTNKYDVSVKVAGLEGAGLGFQNKAANDLPVATNGTYPFAAKVESGAEYDVTVLTQPTSPWQTCAVTNGKANVAGQNVVLDVACVKNTYKVGGKLEGLQGNGLVLQNNAGDDLTLNAAQNGDFSFVTKVASGGAYAVTIKTQPNGAAGELCSLTAGAGTVAGADVSTVGVSCTTDKLVFVTSQLYGANLGGLDGADAKCQALATAANLPGTYRAWLSDSTGSPSTRFTQSANPYKLVNGTVVANSWADLIDGNISTTISVTESGGAPPSSGSPGCAADAVFSNTRVNGTLGNVVNSCTNWTGQGATIAWGRSTATNTTWTNYCVGNNTPFCDGTIKSKLYCFQQ